MTAANLMLLTITGKANNASSFRFGVVRGGKTTRSRHARMMSANQGMIWVITANASTLIMLS